MFGYTNTVQGKKRTDVERYFPFEYVEIRKTTHTKILQS